MIPGDSPIEPYRKLEVLNLKKKKNEDKIY